MLPDNCSLLSGARCRLLSAPPVTVLLAVTTLIGVAALYRNDCCQREVVSVPWVGAAVKQ